MPELFTHQKRGVVRGLERPRYYFGWDPGTGKSATVLTIIDRAKAGGFLGSTLVLCPKTILKTTWLADAQKFTPNLQTVVAWAATAAKRRQLIATPNVDVFVCTYESAKKHFGDFYAAGVRRLVIDEASKCKAHDTQITKLCREFAGAMTSVYLLSGTPAPNGPHEWIPQVQILAPEVFGRHYWRAMYAYFAPIKRSIDGAERIVGWKQLPDKRDEFLEKIRSVSWSLRKSECLDLPPQTDVTREVELSKPEADAYQSMLEELRVEFSDGRVVAAAVQARVMKLRQITGGLVYGPMGVEVIGSSKLDELGEVLDEIGDRPTVIWCEFTAEIDRVIQRLRASGRRVGRLDGRVGTDERARTIDAFQAGKLDNVVCHPAAAGHGVTLVAAPYAIYFSHSFSFEQYQQSRDRIHRVGQTNNTTYYHLIAGGTVDEAVWRALRNKRNAHEDVMAALSLPAVSPSNPGGRPMAETALPVMSAVESSRAV